MTITAQYPGRCSKCGGRIEPGQQIDWDKSTRATRHVTCPTKQTSEASQPIALVAGGAQIPQGRNRKPGICDKCGQFLKPGQGILVRCIEDSGCPIHHDYSGWHVYCADEAACKARREEARQRKARQSEIAKALQATITREAVEAPTGAEELHLAGLGAGVYSTVRWIIAGDTVYVQIWRPLPYDDWERVTLRTTATREQVQEAIQAGAIEFVQAR